MSDQPVLVGEQQDRLDRMLRLALDGAQDPACAAALRDWEWIKQRIEQLERERASILMLGGTYVTQGGEHVTMVKIHNAGTHYETLEDELGRHRYSRRLGDMGRCTGTAHDYSHSLNIQRPIRAIANRSLTPSSREQRSNS